MRTFWILIALALAAAVTLWLVRSRPAPTIDPASIKSPEQVPATPASKPPAAPAPVPAPTPAAQAPATPATPTPAATPPATPTPTGDSLPLDAADALAPFVGKPIHEVRLKGLARTNPATLGTAIKASNGAPLDPEAARQDVRSLLRLGRFKSVAAAVQPLSTGAADLVYTFEEMPVISKVALETESPFSPPASVQQKLDALRGEPWDDFVVGEVRMAIEDAFRAGGSPAAAVRVSSSNLAPGELEVRFQLKNGPAPSATAAAPSPAPAATPPASPTPPIPAPPTPPTVSAKPEPAAAPKPETPKPAAAAASTAKPDDKADKKPADKLPPPNPKLELQEDGSFLVDDKYILKGRGTKDDPYRITWEQLVSAQDTYQPRLGKKQIPDRVRMLDGKWIRISGYIAFPLMAQSQDEMLMMLNQWDGCCIGVPPTPYDAIEVKLKTAAKGETRMRTTGTLTGVLKVDPYLVKDWLVSLYVMDDGELSSAGGQADPSQHAK